MIGASLAKLKLDKFVIKCARTIQWELVCLIKR